MTDKPKMTKAEREERSRACAKKREAAAERRAEAERLRDLSAPRAAAIRSAAAAARDRLAQANAVAPIDRYEQRAARLAAAAKRQRERIDHVVFEKPREMSKPVKSKRQGRRRVIAKAAPLPLANDDLNAAVEMRERWSHKTNATPETMDKIETYHSDCLIQMEKNGSIDKEQLEWAAEIANVYRSIESDVAVKVASFEARVDQSRRGGDVAESIHRVRLHQAYGRWRAMLPAPKQMIIDMIVGDAIGYTVAARRYAMGKDRAKRMLIAAIDRWPNCVGWAYRTISEDDIERAEAAE